MQGNISFLQSDRVFFLQNVMHLEQKLTERITRANWCFLIDVQPIKSAVFVESGRYAGSAYDALTFHRDVNNCHCFVLIEMKNSKENVIYSFD